MKSSGKSNSPLIWQLIIVSLFALVSIYIFVNRTLYSRADIRSKAAGSSLALDGSCTLSVPDNYPASDSNSDKQVFMRNFYAGCYLKNNPGVNIPPDVIENNAEVICSLSRIELPAFPVFGSSSALYNKYQSKFKDQEFCKELLGSADWIQTRDPATGKCTIELTCVSQ